MTGRSSPGGDPRHRDLYALLDELDRLEEVLEAMIDPGVTSRSDIELRLAALNREVDERSDG